MVGRKVLISIKKPSSKKGKSILEVETVSHESKDGVNVLKDISFNLKEGEILGIAGVAGNGQSELLDILSGIETLQKGQMTINDKTISSYQEWNSKKARDLVLLMCLRIGTNEVWYYLFIIMKIAYWVTTGMRSILVAF